MKFLDWGFMIQDLLIINELMVLLCHLLLFKIILSECCKDGIPIAIRSPSLQRNCEIIFVQKKETPSVGIFEANNILMQRYPLFGYLYIKYIHLSMRKLFTSNQIIRAVLFCVSVFAGTSQLSAQITIFAEDFDLSPVNSIFNVGDVSLTEGPSPCGKGSRGDTSDFNSSSIDFDAAGNPSFFLGVNPQAPCGGFYTASLLTNPMDLSGMDSIQFTCSYFKTNTLGWGPTFLSVVFENGTNTDTIQAEFSSVGIWDVVLVNIDPLLISTNVTMHILMGGGEGVGIDNIGVLGYSSAVLDPGIASNTIAIYPNPATQYLTISSNGNPINQVSIVDLTGKVVDQRSGSFMGNTNIQVNQLPNGVYVIGLTHANGHQEYKRFVVTH